jgi:hypothetical protein
VTRNVALTLEVLNVLDLKTNDITYYYRSRLRNEPPEGLWGDMVHPSEPIQFRGTLSVRL